MLIVINKVHFHETFICILVMDKVLLSTQTSSSMLMDVRCSTGHETCHVFPTNTEGGKDGGRFSCPHCT